MSWVGSGGRWWLRVGVELLLWEVGGRELERRAASLSSPLRDPVAREDSMLHS